MRRILFLLFFGAISGSFVYGQQVKVIVDGITYNIDIVNGTAAVGQNFITGSSSDNRPQGTLKGDIIIAAAVEYNGKQYPVTSVFPYAFYECNGLTSVTIPASVIKIDDRAFYYSLPDLKQIIVSPGNPDFCSSDGVLFSKDMKKLYRFPNGRTDTIYNIPSGVESIEFGAFLVCNALRHIVLSDSIRYIKNNAFESCSFKKINIPAKTVEIGENAFNYCTDLTSLMIPYSVKKIGAKAFSDCYNLKSFICQNEKLTIPSDAFERCVKYPEIVYKTPASALIELAQEGDPEYQYRLALAYQKGDELKKDLKAAREWLEKSANKGYVLSQKVLGDVYFNGLGTDKNLAEAIRWYSLAAANGNVSAQSFLGDCYFDAIGVKQDYVKAFGYYKSAALQGDKFSRKRLGYLYYNGKGVVRDYKEAGKWYLETANAGDAESAYYVAQMLYEGKGLEKNDAEALSWAAKAVAGGIEESRWLYCELAYKDAVSSMDGGYYNLAISGFTSLLEYDTKNADVYINRGYCYLNLQPKDYSSAEADFKKALELENDNKVAQNNLQIVNDHYKKSADVKAFCDEGDMYVAAKDYVQAVTSFAKAISIDETNAIPYANIGFCYLVCQQYADAIGFFDKALALDPDFKDAIKGREIAKTSMVSQAISNALNAYSNSLNNAYNSSSNAGDYNDQQGNSSYLNSTADRAVYREQQNSRDKYNMYMRLYDQEQAESDSYFKRYQTYGDLEDLRKSKESQSRANDYLEKAKIWE